MRIVTLVLQSPFAGQFENLADLTGVGPNGVVVRERASATIFSPNQLPATGYRPVEKVDVADEQSLPLLPLVGAALLIIAGAIFTLQRRRS